MTNSSKTVFFWLLKKKRLEVVHHLRLTARARRTLAGKQHINAWRPMNKSTHVAQLLVYSVYTNINTLLGRTLLVEQ